MISFFAINNTKKVKNGAPNQTHSHTPSRRKLRLAEMGRDNSLSAQSSKRVLTILALDDKNHTHLDYRQIAATLHVSTTTVLKTALDHSLHGLDYTLTHHYNPASC